MPLAEVGHSSQQWLKAQAASAKGSPPRLSVAPILAPAAIAPSRRPIIITEGRNFERIDYYVASCRSWRGRQRPWRWES